MSSGRTPSACRPPNTSAGIWVSKSDGLSLQLVRSTALRPFTGAPRPSRSKGPVACSHIPNLPSNGFGGPVTPAAASRAANSAAMAA